MGAWDQLIFAPKGHERVPKRSRSTRVKRKRVPRVKPNPYEPVGDLIGRRVYWLLHEFESELHPGLAYSRGETGVIEPVIEDAGADGPFCPVDMFVVKRDNSPHYFNRVFWRSAMAGVLSMVSEGPPLPPAKPFL